MKRHAGVLALAGLLFVVGFWPARSQTVGAQAEGRVTQEGSPLANVQVVFTNVDNGKTYKTKTDKSGAFSMLGVPYGSFRVDVIGEKGEKLFTEKTTLGTGDTSSSNFLKIDINKSSAAADNAFGLPDPAAPKLTKEQIAKIDADNKKIAGLNSLISEAQTARQAQDWPKAENALKQLISAAPDTDRWDIYMSLAEAQSNSKELAEAVQTYDKGIQLAQSLVSGASPSNSKIPTLNPAAAKSGAVRMLTSQGNAYLKLQKTEEAIASLKKAAAMEPASAVGQYNLCGVEYTAQKFDDARVSCAKFLQLEPSGAHSEEVKGFITQMGEKK
jgi:tetratricopeptide (TPR) repeat protein